MLVANVLSPSLSGVTSEPERVLHAIRFYFLRLTDKVGDRPQVSTIVPGEVVRQPRRRIQAHEDFAAFVRCSRTTQVVDDLRSVFPDLSTLRQGASQN